MTEREKLKRAEKARKVGKVAVTGVSIVKTIFTIVGLVLGGLAIYGFVSAAMAVYDAWIGFIGG